MKKIVALVFFGALFLGCSSKDSPAVTMCKKGCIDKLQTCASTGKDNQKSCQYAYDECMDFCSKNQ